MIEISLSTGEHLTLAPAPIRKFKGTRLPGCNLFRSERTGQYDVIFQEFNGSMFSINYCAIQSDSSRRFQIKYDNTIARLLIILTGHIKVRFSDGAIYDARTGQYFVADKFVLQADSVALGNCSFVAIQYPSSFLAAMRISADIIREQPQFMSLSMKDQIDEMLNQPYAQALHALYYDIAISKLLLDHLATPSFVPSGELSDADTAAIYYADRVIAENLHTHFTINALAKKAGTNAFILKKGFQETLGTSVFQRLVQLRMDTAKDLLEKTNHPIKEICEMAGYQTLGGFITAFKKRYGITPKDWRKERRKII